MSSNIYMIYKDYRYDGGIQVLSFVDSESKAIYITNQLNLYNTDKQEIYLYSEYITNNDNWFNESLKKIN